ncbi:MAG: hypothetical protein AAFR91_02595 [Pseudomonadota bacterium]
MVNFWCLAFVLFLACLDSRLERFIESLLLGLNTLSGLANAAIYNRLFQRIAPLQKAISVGIPTFNPSTIECGERPILRRTASKRYKRDSESDVLQVIKCSLVKSGLSR